ncbi:MAG: hypothetical protein M3Q31_01910 [Actinomycetota bacterium]|nr:hypothetical protein [Actinomycetota bacterium]
MRAASQASTAGSAQRPRSHHRDLSERLGFEQGEESTKLVTRWIRDEKLDTMMPNEPKITSGKVVAHSIEHALVA